MKVDVIHVGAGDLATTAYLACGHERHLKAGAKPRRAYVCHQCRDNYARALASVERAKAAVRRIVAEIRDEEDRQQERARR